MLDDREFRSGTLTVANKHTHTHFVVVNFLGQKSCRTNVPQIFRVFVPNFAPSFAPDSARFFEEFSCFISSETEILTKNLHHFSVQNSQTNSQRNSTEVSGERAKQRFLSSRPKNLRLGAILKTLVGACMSRDRRQDLPQ